MTPAEQAAAVGLLHRWSQWRLDNLSVDVQALDRLRQETAAFLHHGDALPLPVTPGPGRLVRDAATGRLWRWAGAGWREETAAPEPPVVTPRGNMNDLLAKAEP